MEMEVLTPTLAKKKWMICVFIMIKMIPTTLSKMGRYVCTNQAEDLLNVSKIPFNAVCLSELEKHQCSFDVLFDGNEAFKLFNPLIHPLS